MVKTISRRRHLRAGEAAWAEMTNVTATLQIPMEATTEMEMSEGEHKMEKFPQNPEEK